MKRWLVLLALLPNCTGCLAYAYPLIAYTPPLTVPNHDSVHAYRVDVDRTERTAAPTTSQYTLAQIPIDERGQLPSQVEVAHGSGVYDPLGIASGTVHEANKYTMLVRLYRPGYQTVQVQSWDKTRDIVWAKAKDLNDEERAVDSLLGESLVRDEPQLVSGTFVPTAFLSSQRTSTTWWTLKDQNSPPLGLQPGRNASNGHRKALLFAASEYDRLAAKTTTDVSVRDRLRAKANWLRTFADADAVASSGPGRVERTTVVPTGGDLPSFTPMNPPPPPTWRPN